MQLKLSSKTFKNISGFGRFILKINDISFISSIKVITSRISWIDVIYYASVLVKVISVCNLLHHNNGHPAYVINYTICDMKSSALSESA